ncbi:MAG TPA: DUF2934 domain-containing protein [Bryobacteraceae bacterium]|nr:DUF2934 domain-containing protein [Bryobacteraceae bacterium]
MAAQAMVVANATPEESTTDQHQKIENLAYQLWLERGCPNGSDQEDWFRAERTLNALSDDVPE